MLPKAFPRAPTGQQDGEGGKWLKGRCNMSHNTVRDHKPTKDVFLPVPFVFHLLKTFETLASG